MLLQRADVIQAVATMTAGREQGDEPSLPRPARDRRRTYAEQPGDLTGPQQRVVGLRQECLPLLACQVEARPGQDDVDRLVPDALVDPDQCGQARDDGDAASRACQQVRAGLLREGGRGVDRVQMSPARTGRDAQPHRGFEVRTERGDRMDGVGDQLGDHQDHVINVTRVGLGHLAEHLRREPASPAHRLRHDRQRQPPWNVILRLHRMPSNAALTTASEVVRSFGRHGDTG